MQLGEKVFKFSLRFLSGVWGRNSPTSGKKTDEKNYERIVNRHNLKMRFLQKWVSTRPACKECEQVKWARFASNFWQGCIHICLACQFSNRYKSVQLAKQEIQMLRMFALLANK